MESILTPWDQWTFQFHVWFPWPSSHRWGPAGRREKTLGTRSRFVSVFHLFLESVSQDFSRTFLASFLPPTCLFRTKCFPFQYLSIWSDCSVLTMSTGLTAVSWLISVNTGATGHFMAAGQRSLQACLHTPQRLWPNYCVCVFLRTFGKLLFLYYFPRTFHWDETVFEGWHRGQEPRQK